MRNLKNCKVRQQLTEFRDLQKLDEFNRMPIIRRSRKGPDFKACAELLEGVYQSEHIISSQTEPTSWIGVPSCSYSEVQAIVSKMKKKKAADRAGVVAELLIHGGPAVISYLVSFFNNIFEYGQVPADWRDSCFILLHKGGPASDANNWRPIAILRIIYKVFARLLYGRIKQTLGSRQSDEQFGFRTQRSTGDALLIAESVISRAIEFNIDIWIISIDLKKAFDRIEHPALFQALESHGLNLGYRQLLQELYYGQRGILNDNVSFPIERGVRQGDVLSPLLFNSALEHAITSWKQKLLNHGLALTTDTNTKRLTNIRFADDLLLFGKSMAEAIEMMEMLVDTFRLYGLELNVKKTKMLSTTVSDSESTLVDTSAGFIELVSASSTHKYLGRVWSGNLRDRGTAAVNHRITCAWAKYRSFRDTLLNRNIRVGLRLRLFSSTVTPALLYALDTCPLTKGLLDRIDVVQRKMLRSIIGWTAFSHEGETWEERGHRMKSKMEHTLNRHPVSIWSELIDQRKDALYERLSLSSTSPLLKLAANWSPSHCQALNGHYAHKTAGRPRAYWEDCH